MRNVITKDEMAAGFAEGHLLCQEEWSTLREIADLDALIQEGKAVVVAPWEYQDGFQCMRRLVRGVSVSRESTQTP